MIKQLMKGSIRISQLPHNIIAWDHLYSIRINKASQVDSIRRFFSLVSKMGDGPLWCLTSLSLPVLFGDAGWRALWQLWQLCLFAFIAASAYKIIKYFTSRPRPYISHSEIRLGCPPLDQWSFPSGHTLHAVGFTIMLCHFFPYMGIAFIPFALLVAASRVILGLHYVSDVLIAAALAVLISGSILSLAGG